MTPIDGKRYLQSLAYALKACPSPDAAAHLAHIAFIRDKIVSSDGVRCFVGAIPLISRLETPAVVDKASAKELLMCVDFCFKIARRHNERFIVRQDGLEVVIEYGEKKKMEMELTPVDVGYIPEEWEGWVAGNAPAIASAPPQFDCGMIKEAVSWYRSWEVDHGTCLMRHPGGVAPLAIDMYSGGDLVAQSFLLPKDQPPAVLIGEDDGELFDGVPKNAKRGRSILSLLLGANAPQKPAEEATPRGRRGRKPKPEGAAAPPEEEGTQH